MTPKRFAYLLLILAGLLLILAAITARSIPGGLAWEWGGIDKDGLFLCPASGHLVPGGWVADWTNPLYGVPALDSLFTDC